MTSVMATMASIPPRTRENVAAGPMGKPIPRLWGSLEDISVAWEYLFFKLTGCVARHVCMTD